MVVALLRRNENTSTSDPAATVYHSTCVPWTLWLVAALILASDAGAPTGVTAGAGVKTPASSPTAAFPDLPGKGWFDHDAAGKTIRVWTYEPPGTGPDVPVVFVMHGVLRNGEEYREPWIPLCDRHRCAVLVPEFSAAAWPGIRSYHLGNIHDEAGRPVPQDRWAYSAIDAIFDRYKARSGNRSKRYFIFGHSAGAQFVHRLALLRPEARYELAVAANAGAYTLPDLQATWPFGLKGAPADAAVLRKSLQRRVVILLGEQDTDPNDKHLPRNPEALAQGAHRLARGRGFFDRIREAGRVVGAVPTWTLRTVPRVGHDNKLMAPAAAELMLGGRAPGPAPASP